MSEKNDQDNAADAEDPWAAALAEQAEAESKEQPEGKEDDQNAQDDLDQLLAEQEASMKDAEEKKADTKAAKKDDFEHAGESSAAMGAKKVSRAEFEDLMDESKKGKGDPDLNLDVILDVPVTISMEIGRTKIPIRNLLQLNQGSVVELDRLAGEPLDVMVNGTLVAHGEVVVVNEKFGIRLTDVISPAERVRKLK
ncbi:MULTISPECIES: flagellar motor switch protein FliN [unclassified Ectothiorhodospira]|uniref:flagellar motor switch protein FliN n=1 Tax=unclassified Ectothiorhodospira TaxID=2684909 RepID=UPI001EE8524E|nr:MULTISPECIES: flagellar motor switch protein FliN [unclassified Ectothiorhodospira]MCG5515002.1 flagellar motor switch protein FliN [Ectothiorhodospira sp. 9100]MCG5517674.1 flagellar motor switch protein FliN [Ectothiorhodospira sp. 9905]